MPFLAPFINGTVTILIMYIIFKNKTKTSPIPVNIETFYLGSIKVETFFNLIQTFFSFGNGYIKVSTILRPN